MRSATAPRRPTAATLLAVVAITLTGVVPTAGAQTRDDVDQARREAEIAEERAAAAEAAASGTLARLLGAIGDYQQTNADLAAVSFDLVDLEDDTLDLEQSVRERQAEADQAARDVYLTALAGPAWTAYDTTTVTDGILARALVDRATARGLDVIEDVDPERALLAASRERLDQTRADMSGLRTEAAALVAQIDGLLDDAETRAALAALEADAAQEAYEEIAADRERAIRGLTDRVLEWEPLVRAYFPQEHVWNALAVMQCESRGNPAAVNPLSDATGLFQFLSGTWSYAHIGAGFSGAARTDPEANIAAASWLVRHSVALDHPLGPWGHWECRFVID